MKNKPKACDGGICSPSGGVSFCFPAWATWCGRRVGGMISGTAHEARAMRAVIGHDPVELDMHQVQAWSVRHQSASRLARSIT